jgi:hypothetical protein
MWSIHLIDNTLVVPEAAVLEILQLNIATDYEWFERDDLMEDDMFYFNPDHYEHMDFLSNEKIQRILIEHNAVGRVTFADLESRDQRLWGYQFNGDSVVLLKGSFVWNEKSR